MYSFREIDGHDEIKKYLQKSIVNNKKSHAYIINSENENISDIFAKTFAKTLECTEGKEEPCFSCPSCASFDHGNHPDIIYIDKEDKKSISIENIRDKLVSDIDIKPYISKYKIYIISEADTMTISAQNAILKTIEETNKYGIVILVTRNYRKLLDTIRSRCIVVDIKTKCKEDDNKLNKDEYKEIKNIVFSITKKITNLEVEDIIEIEELLYTKKENVEEILDFLILWYRDINILKENINVEVIINKNMEDLLKLQANKISYKKLNVIISNLYKAKKNLKNNINIKLIINVMLLNIKGVRM